MLQELLSRVRKYMPDADTDLITKAYYFCKECHEGQYRNSGEKYYVHPVNVALILTDLNMDDITITAALLHDVLEDTDVTYDTLVSEFGEEVANLVDGVTKLKKLKYKSKQENQAENLRKMVLAMAKDIRVVIIKLADRLHNMRTLEYMNEEKKKEKALETLEIYAPLAHRLGISKIKWELEDLSLRYLDPKGYYDLVEKVNKRRKEREEYIQRIIKELDENLEKMNIRREISGRPKNFYSIYKKMYYQNKSFDQIFDLTAIRVIVDTIKDCYAVLGIVHTMWKPIPGRFKDYIAMPKPNMYQSLHTTVIGPEGEIFEVQIRTWDMHRTAEYGIAAHWKYKEGSSKSDNFDQKLTWLRQLMEWQKDLKDPKEFMETLKLDLFTDEVYVFTPKGDVINLPSGSTPIDFAYRVHTAIGNSCIGAKVDGRIVPLDYKLKNGNIVEILTSPNGSPSRDWLKIVKSSQARNKIRQWFKRELREQNIEKGKELLEKELKKRGYKVPEALKDEWLKNIATKISLSSVDDLYAGLGYGNITLSQVMSKFREYYKEYFKIEDDNLTSEIKIKEKTTNKQKENVDQGVIVKGVDNIKVRFAKCCNPVPGDEIVGYITRGRGLSIHRKDCPNVNIIGEPDRFMEVSWNTNKKAEYQAEIQIKSIDRPGLLAAVTQKITDVGLSLVSLSARTNKEKLAVMNIVLEIKDIEQLKDLMNKIRKIQGVIDVYRVIS